MDTLSTLPQHQLSRVVYLTNSREFQKFFIGYLQYVSWIVYHIRSSNSTNSEPQISSFRYVPTMHTTSECSRLWSMQIYFLKDLVDINPHEKPDMTTTSSYPWQNCANNDTWAWPSISCLSISTRPPGCSHGHWIYLTTSACKNSNHSLSKLDIEKSVGNHSQNGIQAVYPRHIKRKGYG